jgi:hypothetical protein
VLRKKWKTAFKQIIKTFCGDIEERIRACRSKEIAELLANRVCAEAEKGCKSKMVNGVLKSHIDKLIRKVFDQNGNNKYLEEQDAEQNQSL